MQIQQNRPINFHSTLNSNLPSFRQSPSKQFSSPKQNINSHNITTPNFYHQNKSSNPKNHRTGPINFNSSTSLNHQDSIIMNPNLNISKNISYQTHNQIYRNQPNSLFDRYYKQMLLLNQCNFQDIQIVIKNPVVYQQQLKIETKIKLEQKPNKKYNQTHSANFYKTKSQFNQIPLESKFQYQNSRFSPKKTSQFQNQRSEEFIQNEILFNHKKIIAERRAQKQKFLQDIQNKISALQKQAQDVQNIRAQQRFQLQQIKNVQEGIQSEIGNNKLLGKIDKILLQTLQDGQKRRQFKKIEQQMQAAQINQIIDEQVKANNQLMMQIQQQLKGRTKITRNTGTGWWDNKQKNMGEDKIKQDRNSKLNTAVNGFKGINNNKGNNTNIRSMNSSVGFGSRMTIKQTGLQSKNKNKNMSSTFNKPSNKKIINTQNKNLGISKSSSKKN